MKIGAYLFANFGDGFEQKSRPVFERSAVFVFSIVDSRAEKLREQIAVGAVGFHAIQAGFASAARALSEIVNGAPNIFARHHARVEAVESFRAIGGAERLAELVLHAGHVLLASTVAELQNEAAIVRMYAFADFAPEGNLVVAIDGGVVGHDAPMNGDGHERRKNSPTPPRANFSSQLRRVWLPEPSKLSKRPEILERKMRFLTVKLRNRSG